MSTSFFLTNQQGKTFSQVNTVFSFVATVMARKIINNFEMVAQKVIKTE